MRSLPGKTGKEKALRNFLCWVLIPFVFVLDRLFKIWVLLHLKEGEGFPLWVGVLHVTRVNNTGAAFGLWKNAAFFLTALGAVSVVCIVFYLYRLLKGAGAPDLVYGWALVAGGALGNLYDRVHFGYVIDFIDLRVWPVFNVADSAICLGVFWILLQFLRKKDGHERA